MSYSYFKNKNILFKWSSQIKILSKNLFVTNHHPSWPLEKKKRIVRRPGIEPGSTAWKATMLTITPPTPMFSSAPIAIHNRSSSFPNERSLSTQHQTTLEKKTHRIALTFTHATGVLPKDRYTQPRGQLRSDKFVRVPVCVCAGWCCGLYSTNENKPLFTAGRARTGRERK